MPRSVSWGRARRRRCGDAGRGASRCRSRDRSRGQKPRERNERRRNRHDGRSRGRERRGGWERGWDDETESSSSDSSSRTRLAGRVFHEWEAGRKVGSGSFGQCYAAADMRTGKRVCLKVEDTADRSELDREYEYLLLLGHGVDDDCMVTPRAFDYVTCGRKEVLVQELLGPSINSLYLKCGERLSQHSVLMLAPQVIDCIRHVHRCGLVHRDIKPHNFLMGRGDRAHKVYVIDFGLSKRWRRDDGSHIPFALGKHLTGTVRYVSTNVHRGYEQSRRDDLLSIGHMLLYLVKGKLPWQGLQNKKRRHEAVHQVKEETSLKDMCREKGVGARGGHTGAVSRLGGLHAALPDPRLRGGAGLRQAEEYVRRRPARPPPVGRPDAARLAAEGRSHGRDAFTPILSHGRGAQGSDGQPPLFLLLLLQLVNILSLSPPHARPQGLPLSPLKCSPLPTPLLLPAAFG
eukprot:TRINITY_DN13015_c0_g1_i2.p1 TRINITY_DN13015_c0_g1~~TRINITY_DN13015_c0_g1_i2.p1  ORF type:complete len:493 (+),score=44.94 TRINITY_DN13015_c0_g1_i2:100-1479(+)